MDLGGISQSKERLELEMMLHIHILSLLKAYPSRRKLPRFSLNPLRFT
jgi:hypothetical protein